MKTKPQDLQENKNKVEKELELSDGLLHGDLFRFYDNPFK